MVVGTQFPAAFGGGVVHDTDGPVPTACSQPRRVVLVAEHEERRLAGDLVEEVLVGARLGGRNGHALHRCAPARAGDHAAVVAAEADVHDVLVAVAFPSELATLTIPAAAMSVARASPTWVLCSHTPWRRGLVVEEPVEGVGHVPVPHVPRGTDRP